LKRENIEIVKGSDRIIYKFGVQKGLNGLELYLASMKWLDTKDNVSVGTNLGQDEQGRTEARKIKKHLVKLFGKPNTKNKENECEMNLYRTFDNV
jgi:hypothetical protein